MVTTMNAVKNGEMGVNEAAMTDNNVEGEKSHSWK